MRREREKRRSFREQLRDAGSKEERLKIRRARRKHRHDAFLRRMKSAQNSDVMKAWRRANAWILRRKVVQAAVAAVLQVYGIPPKVTKFVMRREAEMFERGGRSAVAIAVLSGDYKDAGRIIHKSFKAAHGDEEKMGAELDKESNG